MKKVKNYIISIGSALAVGGLSAFLTRDSMDIYSSVKTPPFSPPAILFPIVWSVLYILMGIGASLAYENTGTQKTERKSALYTYALSLFFNFMWSILFFGFRAFLLAFLWLLVLLFLVTETISKYRKINPTAAYLQIPYLLWICFAGVLNCSVWILNRTA